MANVKFGAVSWDDIEFNQKPVRETVEREKLPFEFMKLGGDKKSITTHTVRVIGMPIAYLTHYWEPSGEDLDLSKLKRKGYSFMCSKSRGSCILCNMTVKNKDGKDMPNKPKQRYYIPVIDRADGKLKVIDCSPAIAKGIKTLNDNKKWGSPLKYDIDIIVNPMADPQSYYNVVPNAPEALTEQEVAMREDFPFDALTKRAQPLDPDELASKINGMLDFLRKDSLKQPKDGVAKVEQHVAKVESNDSTFDEEFPPA